jgi:uncharacterized lipoprotein NlpE involved in copper resistance
MRSLRASIASHTSWANTSDRSARTEAARQARWAKYVEQARELHADHLHEVDEAFIVQVAEHLRSADMRRMAFKSHKARQRKAASGDAA